MTIGFTTRSLFSPSVSDRVFVYNVSSAFSKGGDGGGECVGRLKNAESQASSDAFAMLQQELIEAKLSIAELNFQNEQQRTRTQALAATNDMDSGHGHAL